MKKIGIECESIENDTWGVARLTAKLLEEIAMKPELASEFRFHLYFKSKIPDLPFLENAIFKKRIVEPSFAPDSFSLYYYLWLPVLLWFEDLEVMFFPNYMLPLIHAGTSVVMLTEDIHYETQNSKLPFRYRLAYYIFSGWAAKRATRIMAISQTSKENLEELFHIEPERISVNHLGVDPLPPAAETGDYLIYVGQAFPRRHLKESLEAFIRLAPKFPALRFFAVGPDKYPNQPIRKLIKHINNHLGRDAVVHYEHVSEEELHQLYRKAKGLVYVSDREAFGLPPMEALSAGVPPIVADNPLGHELFKENAFYASSNTADGIAAAMEELLTNTEKSAIIRSHGPEFTKQYSWSRFADRWLEIVRSL